jgi:hypothetical protein
MILPHFGMCKMSKDSVPDVRVAVLSYFATDWYVDQNDKSSDSPPDFFRKRRLYSRKNDYLMYMVSEMVRR